MTRWQDNSFVLAPRMVIGSGFSAIAAIANMRIDSTTEKLGIKYYPSITSPITDVDLRLNVTGNPGTFKVGIFANTYTGSTSGLPDDATQLGGWSPTFDLTASGWTGLLTLATDTGNLTVGTPIWIVIVYDAGTCDASNYIDLQSCGNGNIFSNRSLQRHHNGTNWTTTGTASFSVLFVLKHQDGSYVGLPITTSATTSASIPDIFVNAGNSQQQGIRFKCGSQVKVEGVAYLLTKTGSPNDLTWSIYEGDTLKYSQSELAANIISGNQHITYFDSPILLAADTYLYIIASQTGTSDSNDYDLYVYGLNSTYIEAIVPTDFRGVYGTGVPSALTVVGNGMAWCFPIISDPATDFDTPASGGLKVHPGMAGGLNG